MSWLSHLPQIFGITGVIVIVVVLVGIGIGVRVALEELRQDPGDYGP